MIYVDTSALVPYYCPEPLSDAAEERLRATDLPAISALVSVEFYSAVARKLREGALLREDAERVVRQFLADTASGAYEMLAVEHRHFLIARDWIARFSTPLRTLDALHLAAAYCAGRTLFTADAALAASATTFGVAVSLLA